MSVIQASNKPAAKVAPDFNGSAVAILKATKAFDLAGSKWSQAVATTMQQYIDACAVTIGRDEAACKAAQKAIRESQVVIDAVASGVVEQKTFTEYAQGAARALHYSVEWSPTLKNDPNMALPWSKKAAAAAAAKAGAVVSTSREDLDATLVKALQQARALGLTGFAADMLDLAIGALDGFKEPTAQ